MASMERVREDSTPNTSMEESSSSSSSSMRAEETESLAQTLASNPNQNNQNSTANNINMNTATLLLPAYTHTANNQNNSNFSPALTTDLNGTRTLSAFSSFSALRVLGIEAKSLVSLVINAYDGYYQKNAINAQNTQNSQTGSTSAVNIDDKTPAFPYSISTYLSSDFLVLPQSAPLQQETKQILVEIVENLEQFKPILTLLLERFYAKLPFTTSRADKTRYKLYFYLLLFHFNPSRNNARKASETGLSSRPKFSFLMAILHTERAHVLNNVFEFLFRHDTLRVHEATTLNADNLNTIHVNSDSIQYGDLVRVLSSYYSLEYVKQSLVPGMLKLRDKLQKFMDETTVKLEHNSKKKEEKMQSIENAQNSNFRANQSQITQFQPFNLTPLRARNPALNAANGDNNNISSTTHKPVPIPSTTYTTDSFRAKLAQREEKRREKVSREQQEKFGTIRAPHLRTQSLTSTSKKMSKLKIELEEKERRETQHFRAKPVPNSIYTARSTDDSNGNSANINMSRAPRLTIADLLREEAVIRRQEEVKREKLLLIERGFISDEQYEQWKQEQRELLQREEEEAIKQRKTEYEQGHLQLQERLEEEKREKARLAQLNKIESEQRKQERAERDQNELQIKSSKVSTLHKQLGEIPVKVKKIVETTNKQKALSVLEESEKLRAKIEREREEELEHRRALIRSIQSMEALAIQRGKQAKIVDLSTESGQYLESMSLLELKARLQHLKGRNDEIVQRKRENINKQKMEKKEILEKLSSKHVLYREKNTLQRKKEKQILHENKERKQQLEEELIAVKLADFNDKRSEHEKELKRSALELAKQRVKNKEFTEKLDFDRKQLEILHKIDLERAKMRQNDNETNSVIKQQKLEEFVKSKHEENRLKMKEKNEEISKQKRLAREQKNERERMETMEINEFEERLKREQAQFIRERKEAVSTLIKMKNLANYQSQYKQQSTL